MSRICYNEDLDLRQLGLQFGQEVRAVRGKRGQTFLAELEQVLLNLYPRRLIANYLCDDKGEVCALGAVARHRLMESGASWAEAELALQAEDPWDEGDQEAVEYAVNTMGLSLTLAWLIMEANDDPEGPPRTPEECHQWVLRQVQRMLQGKLPVDRMP